MSSGKRPVDSLPPPPNSVRGVFGGQGETNIMSLTNKINQIKKQFQANRAASVKARLMANRKNLETHTKKHLELASSREVVNGKGSCGMLSARMISPQIKINGLAQVLGEKDCVYREDVVPTTTVKLPYVEKIPRYTTWTFLAKNQMMPEEESVIGKKIIYYRDGGTETLFCSDSEEEAAEPEEQRYEFTEEEDQILWMTYTEYGFDGDVIKILRQFVGGSESEIQERCNLLRVRNLGLNSEEKDSEWSGFLGKRLSDALDSFDNLFCRRCLVFDCHLHGCSQGVINSSEKRPYSSDSEDEKSPCGDQCYLLSRAVKKPPKGLTSSLSTASEEVGSSANTRSLIPPNSDEPENNHEITGKRKMLNPMNPMAELESSNSLGSSSKKPKSTVQSTVNMGVEGVNHADTSFSAISKDLKFSGAQNLLTKNDASNLCSLFYGESGDTNVPNKENVHEFPEVSPSSVSRKKSNWKPLEKDLLLKGIDMFGRKSCLIARNLLPGLRTCKEVFSYLNDDGRAATIASIPDDNRRINNDCMVAEMPARARARKKGRGRKLKFSSKSTGPPSNFRRNIGDKNSDPCKQYTPCGCQSMCGQECPCHLHGTCCEKYCGCSKSCKNRFRGCHCAKSQCRSRQCPCFASGRECDPDVCRNCWVSCGGDPSLGEPPRQGEGQCGNMKLLLKQQKRILLGRSDVSGWGAFIKKPVKKNDYLGEYTGEVMSHREADKRGKVYDRTNSSYLFNLNDQYVLDAYRKGDKLKFANHSLKPNCYAKVMFVAGDHRVGIYANEHIEAGQELFYDYQYLPGSAPLWAQKPEASTKKNESPAALQGRAKKNPH